jgi:murein DD-endopeptidase MepM/ murein hydrolase activator NlpD
MSETKPTATPTPTQGLKYDILSHKYESNGDPGCVSDGAGDAGGVSYGLYQLASRTGPVKEFVEFCVSSGYPGGSTLAAAGKPGSDSFSEAWKQVATQDATGFGDIQYKFMLEHFFQPAVTQAASAGIDLNKHSDALKCVVWSAAVQYSPYHTRELFQDAATILGQPTSALDDVKCDSDLIQAIYQVRASDEWTSGSPSLRPGLRARFENECNDALTLLSGDGAAISKIIMSSVLSGGLGTAKPSDDGFSVKSKPHGKHADSEITKLPKGKTFCEPVYPDLVTISDKIPQWLIDQAKIPMEKMQEGDMLMYKIPTQALKDACGGDLDAILGSVADAKSRQRVFNPKNYKKEYKKPNPGKPANNNDPFPVDLKIEELETHKPTVKIHTITCCPEAVPVAKAVINVSDRAEKRIVKLENMMATLTRYLFRMASRVHINCVYYGGQTSFEKYKCIRCLNDDRLSDGQMMSMDQCLNCTRYEPIIGQVYEIINELGVNIATVLDDNQMAYMDMQDYVDFTRVENFHKEMPKASINMGGITTRSGLEKDFKDVWPKGVEMKWDLVPVEEQKPHVNMRQSILDDGSKMKKLSSFPMDEKNVGQAITAKPGNIGIMQKNANAMNTSSNAKITAPIQKGQQFAAALTDEFINRMKGGLEKDIKAKLGSTDIDPLIVASIMAVEGASDPGPIIQRYSEVMTTLQIKNPAIVISAYKAEASTFLGDETINPKLPRIDKVYRIDETTGQASTLQTFDLNWDSRETWLWTQFCEPMELNLKAIGAAGMGNSMLAFFPSVCFVYMEIAKIAKRSRFDGERFAFPFVEEQLKGVWYVSPFGFRESTQTNHYGIDLATGEEGRGMEIHAIEDGVVVASEDDDWHTIVIQHADGYWSRMFHSENRLVSVGQTVRKGDVIATVGDWNHGNSGAWHLHQEIHVGGFDGTGRYAVDPLTVWPLLNGKMHDGGSPLSES